MSWLPHTRDPGSPMLAPELFARVRRIHIRTHRLVNTALAEARALFWRYRSVAVEALHELACDMLGVGGRPSVAA